MRSIARVLAPLAAIGLAALALADVPRQISYQGRLTGNGDDPVNLQIRLYDAETGGNELFFEQHDAVPRPSGLFSINIGSQTTGGVPDSALDYTSQNPDSEGLWLAVKVWDGSQWVELTPRTRLVMVPFAAKATMAEGLVKPDTFEEALTVDTSGNVGIGRSSPLSRLHVDDEVTIDADTSFELTFAGDHHANIRHTGGHAIYVHAPVAIPTNAGFEITFTGDDNGNITHENGLDTYVHTPLNVPVLRITGGSDLAEPFAVAESSDEAHAIQPGMVVVIDPGNPGQLKLATEAYDRKVAGIISGANGLQPGMVMTGLRPEAVSHQPSAVSSEGGTLRRGSGQVPGRSGEAIRAGSVSDRCAAAAGTGPALTLGARTTGEDAGPTQEHPVALTGRVWCWCDASYGPITPGDRLTTSDTPGHAMKVTDNQRAPGAVIGKAMTRLTEGKGLVLVLVNLQ